MKSLDDLLQKPDEEIDLGEILLQLSKVPKINKDFDVKKYLVKLDSMAVELKPRIAGKNPEETICEINKYLFEEQGFKYKKGENKFFLNKVLDEKKGNCVGLSYLYLSLAERLGLPIYGCSTPEHFFVRWDDGKFIRNIETTARGEKTYTLSYMLSDNISEESIDKGVYLRKLSKKEVVGDVLSNRGVVFASKGELDKAILDYSKAIELNLNDARTYYNRGLAYAEKKIMIKQF